MTTLDTASPVTVTVVWRPATSRRYLVLVSDPTRIPTLPRPSGAYSTLKDAERRADWLRHYYALVSGDDA